VQATGARLGTMVQGLASIGTGVIIGFIYSWKLTLCIIGFAPFILLGGYVQMNLLSGYSSGSHGAHEQAGKVRFAKQNMLLP